MQPKDSNDAGDEVRDPFQHESRIRILDIQERRPVGHEVQCISEPSLFILRARVSDASGFSVGETVDIPSEGVGALSEVRLKDLSGSSQQELVASLSACLLYTSPSPRDPKTSRMPSSA